jgi:hypothetical protein
VRSTVTVTSPAASTALTTIGTVCQELGVATDLPGLDAMIARASAAITAYLARPLARETVIETFRQVDGFRLLRLSRFPATAIASVVVDGLTLPSGDYELGDQGQHLYRLVGDEPVDWKATKIVVTYTGGYVLPGTAGRTLPPEIEWACIMAVSADYHMRNRDPQMRSESADGIGSQSWLDPDTAAHGGLPWAAAERLQPYRRHDK